MRLVLQRLASSSQMQKHLLFHLQESPILIQVEYLLYLLGKGEQQHIRRLTSQNQQLPYQFQYCREHLRDQFCLQLLLSMLRCFPTNNFFLGMCFKMILYFPF